MGNWIGALVRLIVSAIVLMLVAFLLPGISVAGFKGAFLAALVIAILGWLVEALFGERISPKARGVVGFVVSALVIYLAQIYSSRLLEGDFDRSPVGRFGDRGHRRLCTYGAALGKGIEVFNSGPLRRGRFLL